MTHRLGNLDGSLLENLTTNSAFATDKISGNLICASTAVKGVRGSGMVPGTGPKKGFSVEKFICASNLASQTGILWEFRWEIKREYERLGQGLLVGNNTSERKPFG